MSKEKRGVMPTSRLRGELWDGIKRIAKKRKVRTRVVHEEAIELYLAQRGNKG